MADIRCPMCGNANPDHLEVCQFCQARLTPLVGGGSAAPIGGEPSDGADDWLMALRAGDDSNDYSEEQDVPDWLSELGSDDEEEGLLPDEVTFFESDSDEQADEATAAQDPPDWLQQTRLTEAPHFEPEETEPVGPAASQEPSQEPPPLTRKEVGEGVESDLLSWGRRGSLSESAADAAPPPGETPEAPDEIPDWLAELGPVEAAASAGSTLGWLAELGQDEDAGEDEPAPAPDTGGVPDWLTGLDAGSVEESETQEIGDDDEDLTPAAGEELPAWLSEFGSDDEQEDVSEETVISAAAFADDVADDTLPDWLSEEEDETQTDEALPDWLAAAGLPEERAPAEADAEEWPGDFAAEPEADEDLPDWLTELESSGSVELPVAPVAAAGPLETESSDDTPDWLKELEASTEEELPEWLTEPSEPPVERAPAPKTEEDKAWEAGFISEDEPPAIREEDLTDWDAAPLEAEASAEPVSEESEELPAWLDEFDTIPSGGPGEADDVPAWLVSALGPEADDGGDDTLISPAPVPEELEPELEDWLAALSSEQAEPGQARPEWLSESEEAPSDFPAESATADVPDWLTDLQGQAAGEIEFEAEEWSPVESTAPLEEEPDALDWLPGQEGELTIDMLASGEGIEEGLAPGELPEWLKAMRPNESSKAGTMEAGEYDTGAIERAGPLAGLRGVLSAEPSATQAGRAPAHFVRLQINDLQQQKTDQLQKMVSAELAPPPLKRRVLLSEQRVLRYIIAAVLLFVAVFPLLVPGDIAQLPPKPIEMQRVDQLISGLNASSNVLVVLDYQPGMSGEMDAAASSIFDHLLLQKPRLAVVSTQLAGPALAERFFNVVQNRHDLAAGSQYVNLGYLPGDSTGLLMFAQDPRSAVRMNYDDRPLWELLDRTENDPWQQPALQGVDSLDDFSMTLLVSDDPDTIRRWIEQVSPALRTGTLVVISSAQAEPLVRPYYGAARSAVTAIVPGLPGGAAYEGFLLRPGPARALWDAYSLGSLIAIILVLGAGTYNLYFVWKEREANPRGRS